MEPKDSVDVPAASNPPLDKTKESILRMKKKMFCTHELIQQYNNKLEECDRLKRDLCIAKNETMKWKQENGQNYTKFSELKIQMENYKKNQTLLEDKVTALHTTIAGDQGLIKQLNFKLENIEKECSEKISEADLKKSLAEGNSKILEQEIKKLKKQKGEPKSQARKITSKSFGTQTESIVPAKVDIGINTIEHLPAIVEKVDKSVLTDFHSTKNNVYPIICDRCDSMSKGNIEDFCKIMTNHPPLLEQIMSPPPPQEFLHRHEPPEVENINRQNENNSSQLEAVVSELKTLKQKLSTLECRKKKRKKKSSRRVEYASTSCCHGRHHDPAQSSQTEFVAEIINRVMNFKNESVKRKVFKSEKIDRKKAVKVDRRKIKLLKRKKKNRVISSSNWEVESSDDPQSNSEFSHNLRLKPNDYEEESPLTNDDPSESHLETSHILRLKPSDHEEESSFRNQSTEINHKNFRNRKKNVLNNHESSKNTDKVEMASNTPKTRSSVRIHERSLRSRKIEEKESSCEKELISVPLDHSSAETIMDVSQHSLLHMELEDSQSQLDIDETSQNDSYLDSQDFDVTSNISEEITSERENLSPISLRKNSRKRKRSESPVKPLKGAGRTNLMGKLRALKKNSNLIATRGRKYSIEKDQSEVKNNEECKEDVKSPPVRAPPKKQRIAHVPKVLSQEEIWEQSRKLLNAVQQTPTSLNKQIKQSTKKNSDSTPENPQENKSNIKNVGKNQIEAQAIKSFNVTTEKLAENSNDSSKPHESDSESFLEKNSNLQDEATAVQEENIVSQEKNQIEQSNQASIPNEDNVLKISENCENFNTKKSQSIINEDTSITETPASPDNRNYCPDFSFYKKSNEKKENRSSIYENIILPSNVSESSCCEPDEESSKTEEANLPEITPQTTPRNLPNKQNLKHSIKFDDVSENIDPARYQRGIHSLNTLLGHHIQYVQKVTGNKKTQTIRTIAMKLQAEAEKNTKEEILELVENEEWTTAVYENVVSKLCRISRKRTIAKCIVDVLVEKSSFDELLDRTYTPPAPVMTVTQQRIIALISRLEREPSMSGVFELVRAGMEFNLFKLGQPLAVEVIECFARMLVIMARMKKDRERVRIFCCDALYFLGRNACKVIYIALTIWPEIVPTHGSQTGDLLNTLLHLLNIDRNDHSVNVRRFLKNIHQYPDTQSMSKEVIKKSLEALAVEYTGELEISILLIAKREGTDWAYSNIVNGGLIKITEDDNYTSLLNALSLLGFIIRTFPIEDTNHVIQSTVEKLCKILESSEGPPDKQEGVVSALLSLGRFVSHFDRIAKTILKWKPSTLMRMQTIQQLNSFFKLRSIEFWRKWKQQKT